MQPFVTADRFGTAAESHERYISFGSFLNKIKKKGTTYNSYRILRRCRRVDQVLQIILLLLLLLAAGLSLSLYPQPIPLQQQPLFPLCSSG
jgi:energy-converting hydrogenase Eha subunit F